MNETPEVAKILDWDSAFFGKTIGWVNGNHLKPRLAVEIDDWAKLNKVNCLYFLAAPDDFVTSSTAEDFGYHLTDIRTTLVHKVDRTAEHVLGPSNIRQAEVADIEALRRIAGCAHKDSRFYFDGHFDLRKCDELYEIWIEKSVRGESDIVLVWEESDLPVGYVTAKVLPKGGSIGLVGVDPKHQGKGVGYQLTQQLLGWFNAKQINQVYVVTQGRNIKAQALYQRCGFATHSIELWFHKWYK